MSITDEKITQYMIGGFFLIILFVGLWNVAGTNGISIACFTLLIRQCLDLMTKP
jgi:hypothetical protein